MGLDDVQQWQQVMGGEGSTGGKGPRRSSRRDRSHGPGMIRRAWPAMAFTVAALLAVLIILLLTG